MAATEHPITKGITAIKIDNVEGLGEMYRVGMDGVTRIEATIKSGMYADIPYVRVWRGDDPVAEFCQHSIVGVYF